MKSDHPHRAVFGVFRTRVVADRCFTALLSRGYLSSDINVMMTDRTRRQHYHFEPKHTGSRPKNSALADGSTTVGNNTNDASNHESAAAAGATLPAIAAVGTSLVIPGLNLIVSGSKFRRLINDRSSLLSGGLVAGFVSLGFPEGYAGALNRALQEGSTVISIEGRPEDLEPIQTLMLQSGGEQTYCWNC